MSKFCSFWGFRVVNAVNDAITLYWHILHSSLSGETSSWDSTLDKRKKNYVREMTVEVGFFSARPGCYLGNIRVFSYNRYDANSSILQGMLLAPPVDR